MKITPFVHKQLRDPNPLRGSLEAAYDMAHDAAVEQGYDPNKQVVVQALAKKLNQLIATEGPVMGAEAVAATLARLDRGEKEMNQQLRKLDRTRRAGQLALDEAPVAGEGNGTVTVDIKTGDVLSAAEVRDRQDA